MLRDSLTDLDENGQKGDWAFISREVEIHEMKLNLHDYFIAIHWGAAFTDAVIIPIALKWREDDVPRERVSYWTHDGKQAWEWDGNRMSPTITPSILVYGRHGEPDQWHGFLENGILRDA